MAMLKIAEDKNYPGQIRKYSTEQDVEIAVHYALRNSQSTVVSKLGLFGPECLTAQIVYTQRCRAKAISNRIIHYVLGFDSYGFEGHVTSEIICNMMMLINTTFFPDYQKIICLHSNKPSHIHIHILINPVNLDDYHLLRCNFEFFKRELAVWLGEVFHIALINETFVDVNDKMKWGKEPILYQKDYCEQNGLDKSWFLV